MIERRLLNREYDGPRFVYFPIAKPHEAARSAVKQLVRTFFNDSPSSAMAALLDSSEEITEEEYKRLRRRGDPVVAREARDRTMAIASRAIPRSQHLR